MSACMQRGLHDSDSPRSDLGSLLAVILPLAAREHPHDWQSPGRESPALLALPPYLANHFKVPAWISQMKADLYALTNIL